MTDQMTGPPPALDDATAPLVPVTGSKVMRKAAVWSGMNSFLLRLGQFGVGVVVARLVAPSQFGVFAVAITVQTVIVNVSELGVSAALVRAKEGVDETARVVATIAIASAAVLTAAMFLAAPWLATLLGASQAANAIRILSFTVLLGGLSAVPYALLVRDFRQDTRFFADSSNFVVSSVSIVLFAFAGFGANGLALSRVLGQFATVALLFVLVRPRYLPGWDRERAGRILRFSIPLAGADVVGFALANADYIVIGRVLGALALGFYLLAFNISGWPVSVLGLVVNEVALPAFAHARDERRTLPARVSGAMALTAAISFPVSALIFALAHPLVLFVYGSRWAESADVLAILGLFGSVRILLTLLMSILAALGRSRQVFALQVLWMVSLVPALVIGVNMDGIRGAAIAQEIVGLGIVVPVAILVVARHAGATRRTLVAALLTPLLAATVAGVTAGLCAAAIADQPSLQVVAGGLAGIAVYLAIWGRWMIGLLRRAAAQWDEEPDADVAPGLPVSAEARTGRHRHAAGAVPGGRDWLRYVDGP